MLNWSLLWNIPHFHKTASTGVVYLHVPDCIRVFFCFVNSSHYSFYYTPRNEVRGGILDSPCLSVRLSVCLSVCSLTFRVRPVASTVQDGFFPYLVQMINSMRGCVACDDPWPWPISSRSSGFDLENRVRSVASAVLDGFFLYLAQMITTIRWCVVCYIFSESANLNFWQIFKNFQPWPWKKNLQFSMDSFHI